MHISRALGFGVIGAAAISAASVVLRAAGVPVGLELILGTASGLPPGNAAFLLGLAMHLGLGGAFGLAYAWLMETVWMHGGASTGMILAFIHASIIGMAVGLTPQFHPRIPHEMADPGPFFANFGPVAVVAFYGIHLLYGAVVGHGYGHVPREREWSPAGRL
jgi:hypothetical protein